METKMTMATKNHDVTISAEAVKSIIEADTPRELFENKRVLVLTPDTTLSLIHISEPTRRH